MNASQKALINSYSDQLSSRFYSNSMALQVLISLLLILILVVELVKFAKKTYEWETEYETNLQLKYADEPRSITNQHTHQPIDNQNESKKDRTIADKGTAIHQRIKKEVYTPPIIRVEQIVKSKMPQLAIIAVNIAMMCSYEFMSISGYIAMVLIVISEILGMKQAEHINLKLVLDILGKLLMVGWYINLLTVSKPSR